MIVRNIAWPEVIECTGCGFDYDRDHPLGMTSELDAKFGFKVFPSDSLFTWIGKASIRICNV
jgi:hypothetical protein